MITNQEMLTDDAGRWTAVLERDYRADGQFVYAVRSTGIYCRPSCPSRRPARRQVQFFAEPDDAERAGFRACRRCDPRANGAPGGPIGLVQKIVELIESHDTDRVTLAQLGAATGKSPYYIQRTFKRVVGVSPREFAAARRVGRLKTRLKAGDTVSRAQYQAGFGSSSRLYQDADATLGMTPATYRRGGAGAQIGYTVSRTSLGPLLVAGTERGLCAVRFGESERTLEGALRQEFPQAALTRDEPRVRLWAEVLRAQVDGLRPSSMLPLDIQATAFQRQVWDELRRTPYGSTRSYGDIARALGRPGASRAVGTACGSNPVALAIPCHRAVGAGGELTGYRWGKERKEELLRREALMAENG